MIDRGHALPVSKQCAALGISRGSIYYEPVEVSASDLALMRRLDELHLERPHAGSRMLRDLLDAEGSKIGRRHVKTLMQRMGIEAVYRRPRTSIPAPGHKVFPYLLRGLTIDRANQVWASDITYIPMARGFVYLAGVMAWFARRILAWRLSVTLGADFCIDALDEALRLLQERDLKHAGEEARVVALLIEGLDSGPSTPMTPDDWDEIEREGRRIIAARKARKAR